MLIVKYVVIFEPAGRAMEDYWFLREGEDVMRDCKGERGKCIIW